MTIEHLIYENEAIALAYAFSKRGQPTRFKQPATICFIDIGLSSSSITAVNFIKDGPQINAKILYQQSQKDFGSRDFDYIIMAEFARQFKENTGLEPLGERTNKKIKLRLLQAVEKARKQLTSNDQVDINIDPLMGDEEFERTFSREEFKALIYATPIKGILNDMLIDARNEGLGLSMIELVGEATRMPFLEEEIQQVFPSLSIQRTLNSQEAIANGCAIYAKIHENSSFFEY